MKTQQPCARCNGSGQYSFNPKDGTVCYGCKGSGTQLVDMDLRLKRQALAKKNREAEEQRRALHRAAMRSVQERFNTALNLGYDLNTELGIDRLNKAVASATGKSLAVHCQEELCKDYSSPARRPASPSSHA